jgi:hypothetical protein
MVAGAAPSSNPAGSVASGAVPNWRRIMGVLGHDPSPVRRETPGMGDVASIRAQLDHPVIGAVVAASGA